MTGPGGQVNARRRSLDCMGVAASSNVASDLVAAEEHLLTWTCATRKPRNSSATSSASGWPAALADLPAKPAHDDWPADARTTWPGSAAVRRRLGGHQLAEGVRRARRVAHGAADLVRGVDAGRRALRRHELRRPEARRPDADRRGSEEQKASHLPASCAATRCGARASPSRAPARTSRRCRRKAVRDGDELVVTGQKIWTSFAQIADYWELLVRTDPDAPKHKGITWVICPMDTPGIDIRPIKTIAGTTDFCEVFFDEVRIPVANIVGDENDGWRVAMVTLSFERGTAFISELVETTADRRARRGWRSSVTRDAGTAWDDAELRRELGRVAGRARRAVGDDQAQHLPGRAQRHARPRRLGVQALLLRAAAAHRASSPCTCSAAATVARRRRRAGVGSVRRGALCAPRRSRSRPAPADPAQHHRRARARPAEGASRWTSS